MASLHDEDNNGGFEALEVIGKVFLSNLFFSWYFRPLPAVAVGITTQSRIANISIWIVSGRGSEGVIRKVRRKRDGHVSSLRHHLFFLFFFFWAFKPNAEK